jgi:hypothetical protein
MTSILSRDFTGNIAVLVSSPRPGCRTLDDAMEPGEE